VSPRAPRLSLLGRFSVLALLVMAVLGVAVGALLEQRIERRALKESERLGQVVAHLGIQEHLSPLDLEGRLLPPRRRLALDLVLDAGALADEGVLRVKVFAPNGRIVYSDDESLIGERHFGTPGVRAALAGRVTSTRTQRLGHPGPAENMVVVSLPLRWMRGERPRGVLEVHVDHAPVAAMAARDKRILWAALAVGLVLVWVTLFRIVASASGRLRRQAEHDDLTGLANRSVLLERTGLALAHLRPGTTTALLLIDLDRFKEVNDTLGHDHGDRLLVDVAERLAGAVRRGDTLARLGGDEFAMLAVELPTRAAVVELAKRVQEALRRPFAIGGVTVELDASIGIALAPEHARNVTTLIQRADVAMYAAKRAGSGIETYAADRDPHSPERLALGGELRRAIAGDELELHYQPKVELASGTVTGVEALVRWRHPQRGLLPPNEFIPLAERTGAIAPLTHWVLDAALAQCAAWRRTGVDLSVAINLAGANVVDALLPSYVAELLARHDVPGHRLECEISEHTVMAEAQRALDVLGRLRALGVRLSLDDFGTGNASLAYLKRLPLDEVKIDRSFVMGMADDAGDAVIVRSTIDLARNLGLTVVAEGVETEAVLDRLAGLRCDTAQGYFLSRPLPSAELDRWLADRSGAERELAGAGAEAQLD